LNAIAIHAVLIIVLVDSPGPQVVSMHNLLHRWVSSLPVVLGILVATAMGRASDSPPADFVEDEKLLKDAEIATDGPGLLEFIRKRILTAAEIERIDALVRRLGDMEFRNRVQASRDLKDIGKASLPKLRLALKSKDAEVRRRAAEIIEFIQSDTMSDRLCAAVRLLQVRQPDGAVQVLIDFLPFIEDSTVEEEALGTLTRLGVPAGKVDPALVAALHSKTAAQRAAGAMLVGWAGTSQQRVSVKELLNDSDAAVRFRAAQGILAGRDKAAVPTLISLLEGVPLELSQRVEDLLQRAAGDSAPTRMLGDSEPSRKMCSAAWNDWSKSNLEKLDLGKPDLTLPLLSINTRAKDVALRWLYGLAKSDLNTWKKTSDVPFTRTMGNAFIVFNNREELDQWFLNGRANDAKIAEMRFVVKDVVSVDQYLKLGLTCFRGTDVAQLSVVFFHKVYL
jgi:hypothetical protein